jgi:hypothetical protein
MTVPARVGELLPDVLAEVIRCAGPGYERWAELVAQTGSLGVGGVQPEEHRLGQEDADQQRGEVRGGSDALGTWQVALAQPEHGPHQRDGEVSDGEGDQQRAHAARIAGRLLAYT